jgi:hypothetical protein
MDAEAVRAYMARDWSAVTDDKRAWWADRYQREGGLASWRASVALHAVVRRTRPDYPTERDRKADLDMHVRLRRLLDRASHAFPRR